MNARDGALAKVHVEVALACLRQRRSRQYRVWVLARLADREGSGRLAVADLREALERWRIRGTSPGTLRRLLKAGDGLFWTRYVKGEPWLALSGIAAVCSALGVAKLRAAPVLVPIARCATLAEFRGAIVESRQAGSDADGTWSAPISRRVMADVTGYCERTLRNWQAAPGSSLERRSNGVLTSFEWRPDMKLPPGHVVDRVAGNLVVLRRLPNSYRSGLQRAPRGMIRRVNKLLSASSLRIGGRETKRERLFYREVKPAQRRLQEREEGDEFFVQEAELNGVPVRRSRCGATLWSQWRVADGRAFC